MLFFFFNYKIRKRIQPILIPSIFFFAILSFIAQYIPAVEDHLSTVSVFLILIIITFLTGSIKKIGEVGTFIFFVTLMDMLITGVIYPYLSSKLVAQAINNDGKVFFTNAISFLIVSIFFILNIVTSNKVKFYQLNLNLLELQAVLISVASCVFLLVFGAITTRDDFDETMLFVYSIIIFLLFLSLIYFIWKSRYVEKINILQQKFNDQQKAHHDEIFKKYSEKRKFYHDVSNHLLCIQQLFEGKRYDELETYLSSVTVQYEKTKMSIDTNNYIVDVVVNDLASKYYGQVVTIQWTGKFRSDIKLSNIDLSSLFSNLLQNAYEATINVEENRKIIVDIKYLGDNLVIRVSNPYNNILNMKDKKFISTKKNKEYHGFGTAIIQEIVEKYSGQIDYAIGSNVFETTIVFMNSVKK